MKKYLFFLYVTQKRLSFLTRNKLFTLFLDDLNMIILFKEIDKFTFEIGLEEAPTTTMKTILS